MSFSTGKIGCMTNEAPEPVADSEIQLISDGQGVAVIGEPSAVQSFLSSLGLLDGSEDLRLPQLGSALHAGGVLAEAASAIAASSSQWLKLTKDSAQSVKDLGLMETGTPGISHAMLGERGSIKAWLKVENGPKTLLTNPATLSALAGAMDQLARQQEMSEIRAYLDSIDRKVDDVLNALDDTELSKVVGAGLDIDSAMTVLEMEGRVDDDTWSTAQGRTHTITDALAWALLRLDDLADSIADKSKMGDLAKTSKAAESKVGDYLAVIARCFELQDALDCLRLDRVRDKSPAELDARRLSLRVDRDKRRDRTAHQVGQLLTSMEEAGLIARSKVLLHLRAHRSTVSSINAVAVTIDDFRLPLGLEADWTPAEPTRWWDAARDPNQLKAAAVEVGGVAIKTAVAAAGALALAVVAQKANEEFSTKT